MIGRHHADAHGAFRITSAPHTPAEDLAGRQRRYLISMAVRVVCFVSAVAFFDGWLRYVLMMAAILLPYVAVVFANIDEKRSEAFTPQAPDARALPHTDTKGLS